VIQVDLRQLNIPDDLIQRLGEKTGQLLSIEEPEARKAFIGNNASLWGEVRPCLIELTGRNQADAKCWYCECKGPGFTFHIDHFRPKNRVKNSDLAEEPGYWWLAFEVMNYRLSCQRCNTGSGKRDRFPLLEGTGRARHPSDCLQDEVILLLDPSNPGDPVFLSFSEDGRVYPREDNDSIVSMKAKMSIEVYDLNHVGKVEARKQTWLECKRLAERAEWAKERLHQATSETIQSTAERFRDVCQDIRERVSSSEEFSAMAYYCFRGTGEDWIIDLVR
jgi:uncharacterized protein (TIGR02646 family)